MTTFLIVVAVVVVLWLAVANFIGLSMGKAFLALIGLLLVMAGAACLMFGYGGRSAQHMNPPFQSPMHKGPDGRMHLKGQY